ncbi:MAG: uroporphyrinogen decarboxylase [Crocinitomicaceae bacterium]
MFDITGIDVLGYSASIVLLISFMMKKVTTLRLINSLGCVLFAIWGVLITKWPVVITNVSIIFINIYYLWKVSRQKKQN